MTIRLHDFRQHRLRRTFTSTASLLLCVFLLASVALTDDQSRDPKPLTTEHSTRAIAGELIALDPVNRTGTIRPDRTDAQRRGDWDLPIDFTLLPLGTVAYHGAPAELRHIPIGTHLHGEFQERVTSVTESIGTPTRRMSPDAKYSLALRLEDDVTHDLQSQRTWKVDAVTAPDATHWGTLTVTAITRGTAAPKSIVYQIGKTTRVWKERCIGNLSDLQVGQQVAMNLTYCTLKGPGRCIDIWLDEQSLTVATEFQLEQHRLFMREHGLPGLIEHVDNTSGIVTLNLFTGFDQSLLDDFPSNSAIAEASKLPPFVPGPGLIDPMSVTAAVAEDNLRTWDQINDRKTGPIIERLSITTSTSSSSYGSSGIGIRFQPSLLLEGFRPGRIIRIWPSKWKVDDLPREERMYQ